MTKQQAINLFMGTKNLADSIGVTTAAVRAWPSDEQLSNRIQDRVISALVKRRNKIDSVISSHGVGE